MFKQRVITAVVLLACLLALLLNLNPLNFSLVIAPVVLLAGWEWTNLLTIKTRSRKIAYLACLALSLAGAALALDLFGTLDMQLGKYLALAASILWAIIFLWVQGYPSSAILWSPQPILAVLGIALLCFTWVAIALIIHQPHGPRLLLFAIVIVALADIGGYVAGSLFGKHKLAPVVSPGKTWEGFAGGMLLQCGLIAAVAPALPAAIPFVALVALVIPVALYSVVGDLFESMVKRHSGVKDSGHLLPGHGGVLDRIDGLMAALPLFILLFLLLNPL